MSARLPDFCLVTGNPNKLREVERILGFRPAWQALDLPEIQELDMAVVLRAKAEHAWQVLRRPLVVDETGLELQALQGFPGPLVKWMLQAVGAQGIFRTAEALGELAAQARCGLLYRDAEREVVAWGVTPGRLTAPRGTTGFGWDPIFLPTVSSLTYAELSPEEKDRIGHRGLAWQELHRALDDVAW